MRWLDHGTSFHAAPVALERTTLAFLNLCAAAFLAVVQAYCYFLVRTFSYEGS